MKLTSLLQSVSLLSAARLSDANPNIRSKNNSPQEIASDSRLFYPYDAVRGCLGNGLEIQRLLQYSGRVEMVDMFFYNDLESCCETHFSRNFDSCLRVGMMQEQQDELNLVTEAIPFLNPSRRLRHSNVMQHMTSGKSGKGKKGGKGRKASKSRRSPYHSHSLPLPIHAHKHKPDTSSKTVGLLPDPNPVAVTMGGLLMAHKIQVPASGSDDMLAMAESFEKTILSVLEPNFSCQVSSICGVHVQSNRKLGEVGNGPACEIVFDLVTNRPCRSCDDMSMLIMGAEVFEDTYDELNRAAENGELQTIFCIYAGAVDVVSDPCIAEISSVEGTSLDVSRGERAPITPRPTSPPVFNPPTTNAPIAIGWQPTPPPIETTRPSSATLPPAATTVPPTGSGSIVPTYHPIEASSFPSPGGDVTLPPIGSSPPQGGDLPTLPPVIGQVPTLSPGASSLPPSVTPPPVMSSLVPTIANMTSSAPTAALNGTEGPVGSLYFEGFENGEFPIAPFTTEGDALWEINTERVRTGSYSIKSGALDFINTANSNVTFTTNADWPEGTLVLSVFAGVQLPIDDFLYFVDGEFRGQVTGKDNWELVKIPLPPGEHTVLFSYKSNPLNIPELPPEPPTHIGAAYIDNIFFIPNGVTVAPTSALTSAGPSSLPPVSSSFTPTIANMTSTTAPTIVNVTTSLMPTISNETSSLVPTISSNATSSMVPTISNGTVSLVPSISNGASLSPSGEVDSLSPTISNETSSLVPTISSNATSSMVPTISNGTVSLVPSISNGASLSPSGEVDSLSPTSSNGISLSPAVSTSSPAISSYVPTVALGQGPPGSLYYEDFEEGQFPLPPWFTEGDAPWEIDSERVRTGTYSIKSGALDLNDLTTKYSNLTFITNTDWPDGSLILSALGGTQLPIDEVSFFVDGEYRGKLAQSTDWQQLKINLSPGSHMILFSYVSNPLGLLELPPAPADHIEAVYFDNVYFIPYGITAAPTTESSALPPAAGLDTPTPTIASVPDGSNTPSYYPSDSLSQIPSSVSSLAPVTTSLPPAAGLDTPTPTIASVPGGSNTPSYYPSDSLSQIPSSVSSLAPVTTSLPPAAGLDTPTPTIASVPGGSNTPTYYPSYLPTKPPSSDITSSSPTVVGVSSTSPVASLLPGNAILFDGFETGDLSALDWTIDGVEAWNVDDTDTYEGLYSAHIKTADIPNSGDFSQLDLPVSMEEAGFIQFYFNAPVAMPFESFEFWVDGNFLTPLSTVDGNWTQAGAIISSGDHTVSWRYANNPAGAPDDIVAGLPQPPHRLGEAWLDNVALLPSTKSFVEDWESKDFSANNWILSGNADWTITDTNAQDGLYSATVSSTDITESTGSAKLSIDIITEQGGALSYSILPAVSGPFDIVNVLVDDVIIFSYSNVDSNWINEDIQIQPGKREVTFELQKNPGAIAEDTISTIPKPDGYLGRVWLDTISFTATQS